VDALQTGHTFPHFLPDSQHFLYYVNGNADVRGVYVSRLNGNETRRLLDADAAAAYTAPGQLLFVHQGNLFSQDFDAVRLTLTGDPILMVEQVAQYGAGFGYVAAIATSGTGRILYRAGAAGGRRQFAWFDRSGKEIEKVGEPDSTYGPSLSPDGRRLAVSRTVNGNTDIWLFELERRLLSRFTFDPSIDSYPIWSPDGGRIVFQTNRNGTSDLFQKSLTSVGSGEPFLVNSRPKLPYDWSPDDRFVLYRDIDPKTGWDIWASPTDGASKSFPVVQTPFEERDGQFSPDSNWIAYQSNESGRFEIYVQPFPTAGSRTQITSNGGTQVRWRRDGKELFYVALDDRLMAVPIKISSDGKAIDAGAPRPLFGTHIGGAVSGVYRPQYMVSADGQRFLMGTITEETFSPITVILNWKGKP
jgi:dipeptidyl aminopeptidase/acylaminoacyl peptidase